jgi:hypothetical protein
MHTSPIPQSWPSRSRIYRKRAGEYDEWWFRTGRYDHGEDLNAAWNADVHEVESALTSWLDARKPARGPRARVRHGHLHAMGGASRQGAGRARRVA